MKFDALLNDYVNAVVSLEMKVMKLNSATLLHKPFDGAWA